MDNAIVEEIRKEISEGVSSWRDRELIKHIDAMEERLKKQREDRRRLHILLDENYARSCEYAGEVESLQRDKAALIEVLEWYADSAYYKLGHNHGLEIPASLILSRMK